MGTTSLARSAGYLAPEAAKLSRTVDILVAIILLFALVAANHLHVMLTVGDWDFWIDWKDRRFWVTLTPILMLFFPAAMQSIFWRHFRLPIGATMCILALLFGEWVNRYLGFHIWSYFPMTMVWPASMLASAIALDCVLLLTAGNWLITAIVGGVVWGALFYPSNLPMLAAYHLPVERMGELASIADLIGYEFTRTATPEYLRMIERGTLRTFGGESVIISAAFSSFICILIYMLWWHLGVLGSTTRFVKGVFDKNVTPPTKDASSA